MTYKKVALLASLFFSSVGFASTDNAQTELTRTVIEGEYILAFDGETPINNAYELSQRIPNSFMLLSHQENSGAMKVLLNRKMKNNKMRSQIFVDSNNMDGRLLTQLLASAKKIQPNYLYSGDPREVMGLVQEADTPNDPRFTDQLHHDTFNTVAAWSLLGEIEKPIVVAVTDDGVDLDHEDLIDVIYMNAGEVAGNEIDDDGNGYIDDVYGWDFSSDDNDANPQSARSSHGTHVAGIVAASADNGVGVAGIAAPAAQIMPLQLYGGPNGFTSKVISETFRYAADNGANIITTSYNVDSFVGDGLFEDAIAYVHAKGLIHFNSAGNSGRSGPRRGAFQELILVCSTIADGSKDDVRSRFSNYGPGVDVCAPGGGGRSDILSTVPNDKYARKGGTSMAAPNAAGVAALIWAQNPDWTRDQVVAQLLGTSKNVDAENPKLINKMGAGRVDPVAALEASIPTAQVKIVGNVKKSKGVQTVEIFFSQVLDPATVLPEAFEVYSGDVKVDLTGISSYKMGSNKVVLTFNSEADVDRLVILDTLLNPFGEAIDGDNDGTAGGNGDVQLKVAAFASAE